jgi:hypothetical protein
VIPVIVPPNWVGACTWSMLGSVLGLCQLLTAIRFVCDSAGPLLVRAVCKATA